MNVEYNKNEKGMTLIEVLAALVLLSLFAVTLLSIFPTTASWIKGAGKQTIAAQYANSIMDVIKADSTQLRSLNFDVSDPNYELIEGKANLVYEDNNYDGDDTDKDYFNFTLGAKSIAVDAPLDTIKATATVTIAKHDDSGYYDPALTNKPFGDNLFEITVTIKWEEGGGTRSFELSTIMGAQ